MTEKNNPGIDQNSLLNQAEATEGLGSEKHYLDRLLEIEKLYLARRAEPCPYCCKNDGTHDKAFPHPRRAEPSVAADERALLQKIESLPRYDPEQQLHYESDGKSTYAVPACGERQYGSYLYRRDVIGVIRAALASPAVSQKDEDALFDEMQRLEPNWNANGASRESAVRLAWKALHNLSQKDGAAVDLEAADHALGEAGKALAEAGYDSPDESLASSIRALAAERDGLRSAATAVVARWDSVLWRQEVGTNELISRLRAALSRAPLPGQGDVPLSNAEFLSKRLARVAKLAGVYVPEYYTHEQIAELAPVFLGDIARKLESAAPAQAGDARDEQAMRVENLLSALKKSRTALRKIKSEAPKFSLVLKLATDADVAAKKAICAAMSASQDTTPEAK